MSFSCYESDASSCPTTPTSQESSQTPRTSRENKDAYYALLAENELLREELESNAEKLEELLERELAASQQQRQSPKDWIRENLEEAQHLIDSIVGIKGITEDPLNAAIKMGISQPQPAPKSEPKSEPKPKPNPKPTGEEMFYESYKYYDHQKKQSQPQPRVSISSSIVPSNEELFGY
jgi:DNA-binding protein H-NS